MIDALNDKIRENATEKEFLQYAAANVPFNELAKSYYELYKQKEFVPIRIQQSDFDKHFRIIGFKADGTKEQRGANRWKKED